MTPLRQEKDKELARFVDTLCFTGENPELNDLMDNLTTSGIPKKIQNYIFSDSRESLHSTAEEWANLTEKSPRNGEETSPRVPFADAERNKNQPMVKKASKSETTLKIKTFSTIETLPGENSAISPQTNGVPYKMAFYSMSLKSVTNGSAYEFLKRQSSLFSLSSQSLKCTRGNGYRPKAPTLPVIPEEPHLIQENLWKGIAEAVALQARIDKCRGFASDNMAEIRKEFAMNGRTFDWDRNKKMWVEEVFSEGSSCQGDRSASASTQSKVGDQLCVFCQNNKESPQIYKSHGVRDANGKVTCPRLRKYKCRTCGVSGDYAHTAKYCPQKRVFTMEDVERIEQNKTMSKRNERSPD